MNLNNMEKESNDGSKIKKDIDTIKSINKIKKDIDIIKSINKINEAPAHLYTPIKEFKRLTPVQLLGLYKLKLFSLYDLLTYTPVRYVNYDKDIDYTDGKNISVSGIMHDVTVRKSWKSKINMTEATLDTGVQKIKLLWFNQPYIGKMCPEGSMVNIKGQIKISKNIITISNPSIEKVNVINNNLNLFSNKNFVVDENVKNNQNKLEESINKNSKNIENTLIPIYNETKGVSSTLILEIVRRVIKLDAFKNIKETLPSNILKDLNLPSLHDSILYSHFPTNEKLTESAKKRFLFEEMLLVQMRIISERKSSENSPSYKIKNNNTNSLMRLLNITPTNAQLKVLNDIHDDLSGGRPMQRLIEGDVGSGKTLVAMSTINSVINSKRGGAKYGTPLQAVYLAPTEILAMQQFENIIKGLEHTGINIGYLSGKTAYKFPSKLDNESYTKLSRTQLIKWVKEGQISLLVGTHAVAKKSVVFRDLALVIIDEQHRFGVKVRSELAHKKGDSRLEVPHLLSMTATPIPRTLALSIFGDLDLSIIDELPKGRKPIKTVLIGHNNRDTIWENVEKKINNGEQVYVICTKIEDKEDAENNKKSVETEIKNLQKKYPNYRVAGIHSKLKLEEKENIMNDFVKNKINILVATTLIEVGVNVPNANIMIIENAEVFGLSQLHQLRGRIGRGDRESVCYVCSSTNQEKTIERLRNFASTNDGFKLSEIDLMTRGAGSLINNNQSGMSDMAMEALKNIKLVELAKKYAKEIIDKTYDKNQIDTEYIPILKKLKYLEEVHME